MLRGESMLRSIRKVIKWGSGLWSPGSAPRALLVSWGPVWSMCIKGLIFHVGPQ